VARKDIGQLQNKPALTTKRDLIKAALDGINALALLPEEQDLYKATLLTAWVAAFNKLLTEAVYDDKNTDNLDPAKVQAALGRLAPAVPTDALLDQCYRILVEGVGVSKEDAKKQIVTQQTKTIVTSLKPTGGYTRGKYTPLFKELADFTKKDENAIVTQFTHHKSEVFATEIKQEVKEQAGIEFVASVKTDIDHIMNNSSDSTIEMSKKLLAMRDELNKSDAKEAVSEQSLQQVNTLLHTAEPPVNQLIQSAKNVLQSDASPETKKEAIEIVGQIAGDTAKNTVRTQSRKK
jgi:hypothetical protein